MAISKEKKKEVLEKLSKALSESESVTFVNFHGLGVADTTEMRAALREAGVGYTVAKKTLLKRALKDVKASGDVPEMPGELAISYRSTSSRQAEDSTAPAREIYTFAKKHEDAIQILGGIFEGKFLDKDAMTEIAQIPSLEVLRGMFVNLINSPIQRFAVVLSEVSKIKSSAGALSTRSFASLRPSPRTSFTTLITAIF